MKIGDLVRSTRPRVGIPKGSVGLITNKHKPSNADYYIYDIQWVGRCAYGRRLARDLEVIG